VLAEQMRAHQIEFNELHHHMVLDWREDGADHQQKYDTLMDKLESNRGAVLGQICRGREKGDANTAAISEKI
jgi:hypothetical protein